MLPSPLAYGHEVVFVDEFGESPSPIVTDAGALRVKVVGQRGKKWQEIVPAAFLELLRQMAGPIRAVHFKTIAENCIRRVVSERAEERVGHRAQMIINGSAIKVVKNKSFRTNGGTFHHHSRPAGNVPRDDALAAGIFGQPQAPISDRLQVKHLRANGRLQVANKCSDQFFSLIDGWNGHGVLPHCYVRTDDSQLAGSFRDWNVGSSKRPTTAERHIEP